MARPPRPQIAGGIYHVTARGNRKQQIFLDRADGDYFLGVFADVVAGLGWLCDAYCLMPNHYHLLVSTPAADLSIGMHRLNSLYAQRVNRRHDQTGHLFQGRFHSALVERQEHLLELSRYLVLNPVRAGLCEHPGEWRWSSYRAYLGSAARPTFLRVSWLLKEFGRERVRAQVGYREFVDAGHRAMSTGLTPGGTPAYPKPYTPANRSARSLTRSAAGRPTTLR